MLPLHCSLSYAYMQVYVSSNYLSTSKAARVTARKIGDIPCRRFLPKLYLGQDYYTLEDALVRPINRRYYSLHIVTEYMYTTHTHTHTHADQQQSGQLIFQVFYFVHNHVLTVTVWPISLVALKKVTVRATSKLGWKQGNILKCRAW